MVSRQVEERTRKRLTSKPKASLTAARAAISAGDLLRPADVPRLQRAIGNRAVGGVLARVNQIAIQREMIGGIDVDKEGRMATWEQDGRTYHLNVTTDPYHVTEEGWSPGKKSKAVTKTHYFFRRNDRDECVDAIGRGGVPGSKKKFSDLPRAVQQFVETNFSALLPT